MNLYVFKTLEDSNIFKFAIILCFLSAYVCFNASDFLDEKYISFYSLFAVFLNFGVTRLQLWFVIPPRGYCIIFIF